MCVYTPFDYILADKVTKLISEDGQVARNALSLAVENLEQNDEVKSI